MKHASRIVSASRLEQVKQLIHKNSHGTCIYVDGYETNKSIITIKCLVHGDIFQIKYENIRHSNKPYYPCPKCQVEQKAVRKAKVRQELVCAYCNKTFTRRKTSLVNSKSGLYFCCRECKDMSQRLSSGDAFDIIRPEHYGSGGNYRELAFNAYEHKCACCGWNEDIRILEVHHIDSNRENNVLVNLVILCPICHRKITLGYYTYDAENKCLVPVK